MSDNRLILLHWYGQSSHHLPRIHWRINYTESLHSPRSHAVSKIRWVYLVVPNKNQLTMSCGQKIENGDIPWNNEPEVLVVYFRVRTLDGFADHIVGELRNR